MVSAALCGVRRGSLQLCAHATVTVYTATDRRATTICIFCNSCTDLNFSQNETLQTMPAIAASKLTEAPPPGQIATFRRNFMSRTESYG